MELPGTVNKDPADRVILATTLRLGGRLVTADANLREAGVVTTIW
jgi:PIN domain nuclease of toxin-antitoxin system